MCEQDFLNHFIPLMFINVSRFHYSVCAYLHYLVFIPYLSRLTCSCEVSSLVNIKLHSLFDPFNFKIGEHNLFTTLFTLSCHLLVMTLKPESFNFPSAFPFLGLRMCLILTHQPGVLPKSLLLQPSRYALRSRFIFIFRLCPRVWRFTKKNDPLRNIFPFSGFECKYTPSQYSSKSFYMFAFSGFECKYHSLPILV
ncbi:hypothetical protein Hanom_Chr16g01444731 [Helianthus anomalus]